MSSIFTKNIIDILIINEQNNKGIKQQNNNIMSDYKFNYTRIGGNTRVNISSAEDIKHLAELDKKVWTVLSCPTQGLEIDEQSLKYIDTNNDGAIHVDEVMAVSQWLSKVLTDLSPVIEGKDALKISQFNTADEEGKKLQEAAQAILTQLGKADADEIALADSSSSLDSYRKSKFEAALAAAKAAAEVAAPYGDKTADIDAAYKALDAKVKDYFMRAKLSEFSAESVAALDVQVSSIEAISKENLTGKMDEIATYPLTRVVAGQQNLPLSAPINPAWAAQFAIIKGALDEKATELTEAAWAEIGAKLQAFADYQKSISITEADITLDEEAAATQMVDKLLHVTRDFYTLLRNYVALQDLYDTKKKAIFQSGTLIVDQRALDLCIKVADPGAMAAQATKSYLYLLTCDCVSKHTGKTAKVVGAVTVGDVNDLYVGKNCLYYDRDGVDYDAKIVSIQENPISVKQAMWTPYKKMGKMISDQIDKFAASKDSAVNDSITAGVNEKTEAVTTAEAATAKEAGAKATSFDIAKYAGIFAAVGMAVGLIGSALASICGGFVGMIANQPLWKSILIIAAIILGIMVLISGPSMFIAWRKLRQRNLAPVLNANGWAVNAGAKINIPFGNTLTETAKLPKGVKINAKDPFAEKTSTGKKVLYWLIALCILAAIVCYFGFQMGMSIMSK